MAGVLCEEALLFVLSCSMVRRCIYMHQTVLDSQGEAPPEAFLLPLAILLARCDMFPQLAVRGGSSS